MNWLTKHMLLPFFYLVRAWRYQQVVSRGQQCVGGVLFSKQLQVGGLVKRQDLGEWEQQAQLNSASHLSMHYGRLMEISNSELAVKSTSALSYADTAGCNSVCCRPTYMWQQTLRIYKWTAQPATQKNVLLLH